MRNAFGTPHQRHGQGFVDHGSAISIKFIGTEGRITGTHRTQDALAIRPGYC